MSDLLTAASQALNAPEAIVKRSAEARAKATGTSPEAVLEAWAGGGSVAPAAPVTEAAPPEVEEVPAAEPSPAPEAPPPPPPPDVAPSPAEEAPVPAAAIVAEEEEPFEAEPIPVRVRHAGRVGAWTGVVAGLLLVLAGAPWLLPRATLVGSEGTFRAAVEVVPGWMIGGHVLLAVVVGIAVASLSRTLTGWAAPGMRLVSSSTVTVLVGAIGGAVAGLALAAVAVGFGEASEVVEGALVVPIGPLVATSLLGWAAAGWGIAALVQAVGVPDGVPPEEVAEVGSVRRRLGSAFGIPALAVLAILVVVLPIAYLFISFPGYAPLLGVLVAGGILGFAGLSASRPGMRISVGEFLVALAGIGVVVTIIVAVLTAQGAGHGEEEGAEAEVAEAAAPVGVG